MLCGRIVAGPIAAFPAAWRVIAGCLCIAANALAANPWPGESWNVASNLTAVGPAVWSNNLSGACWNPVTRRLWLADNSGVFSVLKESTGGGFTNVRNYSVSGTSTQRDLEAITQGADTNCIYLLHERINVIREYSVATGVTNREWTLTSLVGNSGDSNDGTEGLTFIPDAWLAASGFRDGSGNLYTQSVHGASGLGGIMLVGVQHFTTNTTGYVYAVDLNTNGTWTEVGKYKTAPRGDSCGLAFDASIGRLYILHNSASGSPQTNMIEVTDLTSAPDGSDRKFTTLNEFEVPSTQNIEGFAITPALTSSNTVGDQWCFFCNDDGDGDALRWFKQLPSPISIHAGSNQSAVISATVPIAPSVLVQDAFMNPLPGFAIEYAVVSGGGSVTDGLATTDTNGIAAVGSWTVGPTPGVNTMSASGAGLGGSPVTFSVKAWSEVAAGLLAIGINMAGGTNLSDGAADPLGAQGYPGCGQTNWNNVDSGGTFLDANGVKNSRGAPITGLSVGFANVQWSLPWPPGAQDPRHCDWMEGSLGYMGWGVNGSDDNYPGPVTMTISNVPYDSFEVAVYHSWFENGVGWNRLSKAEPSTSDGWALSTFGNTLAADFSSPHAVILTIGGGGGACYCAVQLLDTTTPSSGMLLIVR